MRPFFARLLAALPLALTLGAPAPAAPDLRPAQAQLLADRDAFAQQLLAQALSAPQELGVESLGIKLIQAVKDGQTICTGTYKASFNPAFEYRFVGSALVCGRDYYRDGTLMHQVDASGDGQAEAYYSRSGQAFLTVTRQGAEQHLSFLGLEQARHAGVDCQGAPGPASVGLLQPPSGFDAALEALAGELSQPVWRLVSWGDWPRLKVQTLASAVVAADGGAELQIRSEGFCLRAPLVQGRLQGLLWLAALAQGRPDAVDGFEMKAGLRDGRALQLAGLGLPPGVSASAGAFGRCILGQAQGPQMQWQTRQDCAHPFAAGLRWAYSSCEAGLKEGPAQEWRGERLVAQGAYHAGQKEGPWVERSPWLDGWRVDQGAYAAGLREGLWRSEWEGTGYAQQQAYAQGLSVGAQTSLRSLSPVAGAAPLRAERADAVTSLRFPDGCELRLSALGAGLLRQPANACPAAAWAPVSGDASVAPSLDKARLFAACVVSSAAGSLVTRLVAVLPDPALGVPPSVALPQLGWTGASYRVEREGLLLWDPARLRSDLFSLQGAWLGWRDEAQESAGTAPPVEALSEPGPAQPWSADRESAGQSYRFFGGGGAADDPQGALTVGVQGSDGIKLGQVTFLGALDSGPIHFLSSGGPQGAWSVGSFPIPPAPSITREDPSVYVLTRAQGALQLWSLTALPAGL